MDTGESAKPDFSDISSNIEPSSPASSASVAQSSELLSLPRELRNEIYQHFVPTWAPQLEYRSLRLTCRQLKDELDEEILHIIKQYHKALTDELKKSMTVISHHTLLPNMLPEMAHTTSTVPGLSVSIVPPTTFAESRTLHLKLADTHTNVRTIRRVLVHVIPHIRTCIFEHPPATNRAPDAMEIRANIFAVLGSYLDRSIERHAGISRFEIRLPALDAGGQEQVQEQLSRGRTFRYSQTSYEAFASLTAAEPEAPDATAAGRDTRGW